MVATIVFLLCLTVGTVYLCNAVLALFKRNGKAKKHFGEMGIFGIIIPIICAVFIGLTSDTNKELELTETNAKSGNEQKEKEKVDKQALQELRELAFHYLAEGQIENPLFVDGWGYMNKLSGDAYSFGTGLNEKAYNEKYDADSKKLFKRKDLTKALENYGFVEVTKSNVPMFPRLTGNATEFATREDYSIEIYFKAYWKKGLLLNDKDNYYALSVDNLEIKDNAKLEQIFKEILGKSTGKKAMKWYRDMQEEFYNPVYYYRFSDSYASISTGSFAKKMGDYTFIMKAEFDESEDEFEDAFSYQLDILNKSYIEYLGNVYKDTKDIFDQFDFSKENQAKILEAAKDFAAGRGKQAEEAKETMEATQSESYEVEAEEDSELSYVDQEDMDIIISDVIDHYLYTYANLETEYLFDTVDTASAFYNSQENYMNSLSDRGIYLQLNNYDIVSINHLDNGKIKVTVNESFTISNPETGEKDIEQTTVYTVELINDRYLITNLEV